MLEIKYNHYIDTVIYACDIILKNLKADLREKLANLDLGITSEQFVVLDTISANEQIYQQQISEILMKDKSNTTRIIKILLNKKLIKKEIGSINNRTVHFLKVTEDGQKILNKAIPRMKKYIEEIFNNISDKDIDSLHEMSKRFQKDLSL